MRAKLLYDRMVSLNQNVGAHRFEVTERRKTFYVEVRIQRPQVWIYIDSTKCPTYLSGMVWIKSFFDPTVEEDGVEYLRTLYPKDSPTTEVNVAKLANVATQMLTVRPGMFSGEMRKVVQVLLGQGKEVPYSPRSGTTHGVYRTAQGTPWVIRISSAGVVAYLMNVCSGKNSPGGLGYTPLPTAEPEEPRVLLNAAGVKDAYTGKGAFYGACGWAFSENGSKAANCFLGSDDTRSYSWQYIINISADSETGDPVSASMALASEGFIHGPKTTHMKYPRGDIPTAVFSFNPYNGDANYRDDCASPVFCYYAGETLQTYYYVFAPSGSFSRTDNYDSIPGSCSELEGVMLFSGSYSESAAPVIQLNSTKAFSSISDNRATRLMTTEGPFGMGSNTGDFDGDPFVLESWNYVFTRETDKGLLTGRTNVLIVTGYEREAAYLAQSISNSNGGYSYTEEAHGMGRATYFRRKQEACTSTFGGEISFIVEDFRANLFNDGLCPSGQRFAEQGLHVFPGTGPGSVIKWKEQNGYIPNHNGCLEIWQRNTVFYPGNFDDVKRADVDLDARSSIERSVTLRGSGGFTGGVDASLAELGDWLNFIESGMNDQTAVIVRDAFKPTRAAYSNSPNKPRGFELNQGGAFAPYDLSDVNSSAFLFVGVP